MLLRRCSALRIAVALIVVGLLAGEAAAQGSLPADWQSLPASEFVTTAAAFLETQPPPDIEQVRPVLQHAWDQFLATDAQTSGLEAATLVSLIKLLRPRVDVFAPYASEQADAVETRLFEIGNAMQGQLAQADFSAIMGLWSDETLPRHRLHRRPALLEAGKAATAWMSNNDWTTLSPVEKSYLAEFLVADLIDRDCYSIRYNEFSIRWSGTIRPPAAGNYRLGQLRHIQRDGSCRIVVDGNTVLDTFTDLPEIANPVYWSEPVALPPQKSLPIQIEYSFSIEKLLRREESQFHLRPRPLMVLLWESQATGQQLVPASALAPPAELAKGATQGLHGTYFNGPTFSVEVATRIDPQLNFTWYMAPVIPRYPEQFHAVMNDCIRLLTDPQATTPQERQTMAPAMWFRLANMADYSQRRQIYNWLISQPDELAQLASFDFGQIFGELGMLPGTANLDLLYAWDQQHPADELDITEPAGFRQFYRDRHFGHNRIGAWLSRSRVNDLNELIATNLVTADGQPRLNLIRVAAHGLTIERRIGELQAYLQAQLSAAAPGDDRARWFVADAVASECYAYQDVIGSEGLLSFESARQEAQSPVLQLEIECLLAIREICLGMADQATARLTAAEARFTQPEQAATIARLQATAERLAPLVAAVRESRGRREATRARAAHVSRLRSRMERAQARGDTATAARYSRQLSALEPE